MKNNKSNKKPLNSTPNTNKVNMENVEKVVAPKNAHTALYKTALLVLNLVGFPVLLILCILTCKEYSESGIYKITVYAPALVAGLMWGLTALIQFIIFRNDKKKHRSFKHTMLACTAVPICCLSGLWLLLDIALPSLLQGATSNTILYEDIVVDAKGKHEHILSIAQNFMYKNNMYEYDVNPVDGTPLEMEQTLNPDNPRLKYLFNEDGTLKEQYSGKLKQNSNGEYLIPERMQKPKPKLDKEGNIKYKYWFCKENKELFDTFFSSFDQAYQTFNGLAIEYALSESDLVGGILSGKIPLTVLMTIILKTSPEDNKLNVKLDLFDILSMNMDRIVGAVGDLINSGFDFSTEFNTYTGKDENVVLDNVLKNVVIHMTYDNISWNVLQLLGDNPLSNVDPNGDIVRYKGTDHEEHLGACMGYQDMAWLNSIDLLGIIICLLDCRKYFYIFGAVTGILTYLAFILKKKYMITSGGIDLTILPHGKRMGKDKLNNYFFQGSSNTFAEIDELEEKGIKPKKVSKKENEKTFENSVLVAKDDKNEKINKPNIISNKIKKNTDTKTR